LTLARILVTLDTGQIVSKDAAADMIAPTLNDADRALMNLPVTSIWETRQIPGLATRKEFLISPNCLQSGREPSGQNESAPATLFTTFRGSTARTGRALRA